MANTLHSINLTPTDWTNLTAAGINGNVTQTWHTQPYISLPQFVFVGL